MWVRAEVKAARFVEPGCSLVDSGPQLSGTPLMDPVRGPHQFPGRHSYAVARTVAEARGVYEAAVRSDPEAVTTSIADTPAVALGCLSEAISTGEGGAGPSYVEFDIGPDELIRPSESARERWSERTTGPMTLPTAEGEPRQAIGLVRLRDLEDGDALRRWTYDTFVNAWNVECRALSRYGVSQQRAASKRSRLQQALETAESERSPDTDATPAAERDCVVALAAFIAADVALRAGAPPEITDGRGSVYQDKAQLVTDIVALAIRDELDAKTLVLEDEFAGARTRERGGRREPVLTWEAFYEFVCGFTRVECGVGDREAVERALTATGILDADDRRPPTDRIRSTVDRLVEHAERWARQPYGHAPTFDWVEVRKSRRQR